VGPSARLFFGLEPLSETETQQMDQLQNEIQDSIDRLDPAIELIALERPERETLRIYIDHPDGVGLALCESVTRQLGHLTADYALEVSSPGLDRPLTKPEHYARFAGHEARVRLAEPLEGQRNFTGTIVAAGDDSFTLQTEHGTTEIPLDRVHRSNLVPELSEVPS
jgi:ribosome maturation factor RimP